MIIVAAPKNKNNSYTLENKDKNIKISYECKCDLKKNNGKHKENCIYNLV